MEALPFPGARPVRSSAFGQSCRFSALEPHCHSKKPLHRLPVSRLWLPPTAEAIGHGTSFLIGRFRRRTEARINMASMAKAAPDGSGAIVRSPVVCRNSSVCRPLASENVSIPSHSHSPA